METHFPFFYNKPCKKEKRWERMEKMALLEVKNVKKIYTTRFGNNQVEALKNVNFSVESGEYVAIMGESGQTATIRIPNCRMAICISISISFIENVFP